MDASRTGDRLSARRGARPRPGVRRRLPTRIIGELYGYPDRRALAALIGIDAHADAVQVDRHGRLAKGAATGSTLPFWSLLLWS
jgi:hypothetical protein